MIGDEAGILAAGDATAPQTGGAPEPSPGPAAPPLDEAPPGAPVGSPFADAAGARLLAAADGRATATMTIPSWLTDPTPDGALGTAAVAALAEIAMGAAGNADLDAGQVTVTATIQLRTRGSGGGWPRADRPAPRVSVFAPPPGPSADRHGEGLVQLSAEARVRDTEADEPGAALRRLTATISTPEGSPLATASAIRSVVRSTRVDRALTMDAPEAPREARPSPCADASALARRAPGGLVSHRPPAHPLLAELAADVRHDRDRATLLLTPPAWLGNRLGRVHTAASCALVDAAIRTALARCLPTGSAVRTLSLDLTVVRSLALEADVTAVATVRHVGRRLAVVDVELGQVEAPPSVLARATVSRTSQRLSRP